MSTKAFLRKADQLLADLPQLLPLDAVGDLLRDLVLKGLAVIAPGPVCAALAQLGVAHHLIQPVQETSEAQSRTTPHSTAYQHS